jgi:hypothetical protein
MLIRSFMLGASLVLMATLSACTHVKPYQREYLTRPGMDTSGEAQSSEFEAHVQSAREGAIGGHGTSTGGGCGCN